MNKITDTSAVSLLACDDGFDPIEDRLRANIRSTIEAVFNEELDGFLGRLPYGREAGAADLPLFSGPFASRACSPFVCHHSAA